MAAVARGARTNLALLALLAAAFLTGWLAFAFATAPSRWSLIIHATSGFAIIALLPWKSMIAPPCRSPFGTSPHDGSGCGRPTCHVAPHCAVARCSQARLRLTR